MQISKEEKCPKCCTLIPECLPAGPRPRGALPLGPRGVFHVDVALGPHPFRQPPLYRLVSARGRFHLFCGVCGRSWIDQSYLIIQVLF